MRTTRPRERRSAGAFRLLGSANLCDTHGVSAANPDGSTGDGVALALWAGVPVSDIDAPIRIGACAPAGREPTTAVAAMFVASEDATSGSVMQNALRMSARSSGSNHCLRCASSP